MITTIDPRRAPARPRNWTQADRSRELDRAAVEYRRRQAERRDTEFGPDERPGKGDGSRALVVGRFNPPHAGHRFVFDMAREYCDELTILLRPGGDQVAPVEGRAAWVREMCPAARVKVFATTTTTTTTTRTSRGGDQDWGGWAKLIRKQWGGPCHVMFGSDISAEKTAGALKMQYVPVDPQRRVVPVSAREIRADVWRGWPYLPAAVRGHLAARVVLLGPEGSGKSTLAARLAEKYQTVFVPEQARALAEAAGGGLRAEDLSVAAARQLAAEAALARQANRVLICDTDVLSLRVWAERLWDFCPDWIVKQARATPYDLYLIPGADSPNAPADEERAHFEDACVDAVESRAGTRERIVRLRGGWKERFEGACAAIDRLLHGPRRAPSVRG
jgi:HTH-type transcriptional regulator, transcriptional repressor of NAD biosynthesis genes